MSITPSCLAIDVGTVRIGTAKNVGSLVLPWEVVDRSQFRDWLSSRLPDFDVLVFGLPLDLKGHFGTAAQDVLRFVDQLNLPSERTVRYVDERLTSVVSQRSLREAGKSSRDTRSNLDSYAAAEILRQAIMLNPTTPGKAIDDWNQ